MSEPIDPSKSLREQVAEYKERQRALEKERAAESDGSHHGDDDDAGDDGPDWTDEERRDLDALARAGDVSAGAAGLVKIVTTVFLGVGVVLLLVSAALFVVTRRSVAAEVETNGTVVRNVLRQVMTRPDDSSDRTVVSDLYYAVVEFRLPDGTLRTVEMTEGNWPKAYDEGESVTVRYDPGKPLHARVGGGGVMDFFASLLTGFLGVVFSGVALGVRKAFASTVAVSPRTL